MFSSFADKKVDAGLVPTGHYLSHVYTAAAGSAGFGGLRRARDLGPGRVARAPGLGGVWYLVSYFLARPPFFFSELFFSHFSLFSVPR